MRRAPEVGTHAMTPILALVVGLVGFAAFAAPSGALAETRVARTPAFAGGTPTIKTAAPVATVQPAVKLTGALPIPAPHIDVDDGGTAYVAWRIPKVDSGTPDLIGFCRLPRGATACTNPPATRVLRPTNPDGHPDGDYQDDATGGGAYPVIVGNQLVILSSRENFDYEHQAGVRRTVAFVSDNGGDSFTGGGPVSEGIAMNTRPVGFGLDNDPYIGLLGPSSFGSAADDAVDVTTVRPGVVSPAPFRLGTSAGGTDTTESADALAALPDGGIAAAYSTLDSGRTTPASVVVRKFAGPGRPNSEADFSAPERFPIGAEQEQAVFAPGVTMANSPAGLLVGTSGDGTKSRDTLPVVRATAGGSPVALADKSARELRLANAGGSANGQVLASYTDSPDSGSGSGLYVRRSTDGRSFSPPERLTSQSAGVHRPEVAAAPDGGGFVAFQDGATTTADGAVSLVSFGPGTRSSLAGLPGTVPGEESAAGTITRGCREITVAAVHITPDSPNGCFLNGRGADSDKTVSDGPINYNGLRITPLGDTQLVFYLDKATRYLMLYSTGLARVEAPSSSGDITLFVGKLMQAVKAHEGDPILELEHYPAVVMGFTVANVIKPLAHDGGVMIPVDLQLGRELVNDKAQQTGHSNLVVTAPKPGKARAADVGFGGVDVGLDPDSLHVHVASLPVGGVVIRDLDFTWTRAGNVWAGKGTVLLPPFGAGAKIDVEVVYHGDAFSAIGSFSKFPGFPLFTLTFLHEIVAGFDVDGARNPPLIIRGGVKIGAIPLFPGSSGFPSFLTEPIYVADLDATPPNGVTMKFGSPFVLTARGEMKLFSLIPIANAGFEFRSSGYINFDGTVALGVKPALSIYGHTSIGVSGKGFNAEGGLEACGLFLCGGSESIVSSKGIGICIRDPAKDVQVSFAFDTGDFDADFGCNFDPLSVALTRSGARAAIASGGLPVPAGAGALSVNLHTAGGAPSVDLVDPTGATVPVDGKTVTAYPSPQTNSAVIVVVNPKAGSWSVVPRAGSPALTRVKGSVPAPEAQLAARLSKARGNGKRTITYRLTGNPNATVSFVELTREGERKISGAGRSGKVVFTPIAQTSGTHTITAQIAGASGLAAVVKRVATFKQPRLPRLAAPGRVRVTKVGSRLKVQVTPSGSRRTGFLVTVRYGDGGRGSALIAPGRASARVRAPAKSLSNPGPTRIRVQAVSEAGKRGPARTTSVAGHAMQKTVRKRRR